MRKTASTEFSMRVVLVACLFAGLHLSAIAQDEKSGDKNELGNKEYIIVKDYKPILAESQKISETPDGDSAVSTPPVFNYQRPVAKSGNTF